MLELYPETKLGIGPPIDTGFYYDFDRADALHARRPRKNREENVGDPGAASSLRADLHARKKRDCAKYGDAWMKCELITERAGEIFSEYTLGPHFIDFCRGPHVPNTAKIKAFKLLSIAGAYWKGDEHNKQLQRIYGTAFFTQKDLEDYLQAGGGGQEARSPQAGQGTRPVQHPGTGRSGADLLPSEGRHHPQAAGRLDARPVPEARLLAGVHAARGAFRPLENLGPRELLRRQHVHAAWNWTTRNTSSSR